MKSLKKKSVQEVRVSISKRGEWLEIDNWHLNKCMVWFLKRDFPEKVIDRIHSLHKMALDFMINYAKLI